MSAKIIGIAVLLIVAFVGSGFIAGDKDSLGAPDTLLIITVPLKEVHKQSEMGDYTEIVPDFGDAEVDAWGQARRYGDSITVWVDTDDRDEVLANAVLVGEITGRPGDLDLQEKVNEVLD